MSFCDAVRGFFGCSRSKETLEHQWFFDDKTVNLTRSGDSLRYSIIQETGAIRSGSVATIAGVATNKMIRWLIESEPAVFPRRLEFKELRAVEHWTWEGKKLSLLKRGEKLVWQLLDKSTKKTTRYPFAITFVDVSHDGRRPFFNHFTLKDPISKQFGESYGTEKYIPAQRFDIEFPGVDVESYIRDCMLLKVDFLRESKLQFLIFKPLTSYLDHSKSIDSRFSTVTLANTAEDWHGHAVIILETIKARRFQMFMGHLTAGVRLSRIPIGTVDGKVHWHEIDPERFQHFGKTETWRVLNEKVQRMVLSIEKEVSVQKSGQTAVCFNASGRDALINQIRRPLFVDLAPNMWFPEVHNCMTWGEKHLAEADINLEPSKLRFFAAIPKVYTGNTRRSTLAQAAPPENKENAELADLSNFDFKTNDMPVHSPTALEMFTSAISPLHRRNTLATF
jgi:hypothetical protein